MLICYFIFEKVLWILNMFIYISSNICSSRKVKYFNTFMNTKCVFVTLLDSTGRYCLTLCMTEYFKWYSNPWECHHKKHLVRIMFRVVPEVSYALILSDFCFIKKNLKLTVSPVCGILSLVLQLKSAFVPCIIMRGNILLAPPLGLVALLTWVRWIWLKFRL